MHTPLFRDLLVHFVVPLSKKHSTSPVDELIPKTRAKAGRRQCVTAKAWISRINRRGKFTSNVSLGTGKTHKRKTDTTVRRKALDFNRAHLLELLTTPPGKKKPATSAEQLDLIR